MSEQERIQREREAGRRAFRQMLDEAGDTRTDEERHADVVRMTHYTPEQAEKQIADIERSGRFWFSMERGTTEPVTYTKDEMIELIRRNTLR